MTQPFESVQHHVHHHHYCHDPALDEIRACLDVIREQLHTIHRDIHAMSATLQDAITALQAEVAAENSVIDSAVLLINGFAGQLAAAIAAATAAGATTAQLQSLTDLGTSITSKQSELAAAVAANTPPATA